MAKTEIATLAGGCFWGMEDLLGKLPGVLDSEVGYTGGTTPNASGHAEAVQIQFNPQLLSYEDLLLFFFKIHDPTTEKQQGNDFGSQYRSAIFYHNQNQLEIAKNVIDRVNKSKAWKRPLVTEVKPLETFYRAEDSHQDYLKKHPQGYTCHFLRNISF
jgi:methionine-S-sulfoxide reductase